MPPKREWWMEEVATTWEECSRCVGYTPLLPTIAALLQERIDYAAGPTKMPSSSERRRIGYEVTVFDSTSAPKVSIDRYIMRLVSIARCSPSTWVTMWQFIGRLEDAGIVVSALRVHRMILAATVVATKLNDDSGRSNRTYSYFGGVPLRELNKLERATLALIDWDTLCTPADWAAEINSLARYGGELRLLALTQMKEPILFPNTYWPFADQAAQPWTPEDDAADAQCGNADAHYCTPRGERSSAFTAVPPRPAVELAPPAQEVQG
eukprot:TRINITY_DN13699_c1_g1_i1.p1 TRINITY_DN13699_c1_g1~~TRINITY_DN13699_c1_g1_i1.p1  ORF type:complete len:266 (+),score=65.92 TRINITY_DN13699_c1_g1_i1:64-861(+)